MSINSLHAHRLRLGCSHFSAKNVHIEDLEMTARRHGVTASRRHGTPRWILAPENRRSGTQPTGGEAGEAGEAGGFVLVGGFKDF